MPWDRPANGQSLHLGTYKGTEELQLSNLVISVYHLRRSDSEILKQRLCEKSEKQTLGGTLPILSTCLRSDSYYSGTTLPELSNTVHAIHAS